MAGGLRRSTAELASLFQIRMEMLRNRPDIIRQLRPLETAVLPDLEDLLPEPRIAVGIDGSMDYDEVLEMLLFYVAAGGYQCRFAIRDKRVSFDLLNSTRTDNLFASAAVPLWEEDLLNLVPGIEQIETEVDFRTTMERIPFALMTMAELYLGWKIISNSKVRVLFLDRPFSGTYPSLYRDTAFLLRRKTLTFDGLVTKEGSVERFDLRVAHAIGSGIFYVPARGIYLPYAVLRFLMHHPEASRKQIEETLNLDDAEVQSALRRLRILDKDSGGRIFAVPSNTDSIRISDEVQTSWLKVRALALETAHRIFNPPASVKHPLLMDNGSWLSVTELNALNLFLVEALIEEAFERNVLVIGVAKDTTATDFTRAALPTALLSNNVTAKLPGLKSDKALLTILSTANAKSLATPWRTFAYDGCMATAICIPQSGIKLRAARRTITRERLFIRCYFQLRSFQNDPDIRAPVFLYDRLYTPKHDDSFSHDMSAVERERDEVTLHLFLEREGERSKLDDVVLLLLSACDNPEVLEAYGHNQLLYLADKLVKGEVELMKGLLRGVVDLELTPLARREKVFSIARRFRDLRAESESARKHAVKTSPEV